MMMTKRRDIVDSCSFSHGLRMMELYLLCIYLNAKRLQLRCKHSSSNLKANDDLTGEFFENLKRIDLAWPNQAHTQSHSRKIENRNVRKRARPCARHSNSTHIYVAYTL